MKVVAKFPLEVPIGDAVQTLRHTYVCRKGRNGDNCDKCVLQGNSFCHWLRCWHECRDDKTGVYFEIFKEVKR